MINLKNKKFYISLSILIVIFLILISGFYCVKSKISLKNEMNKIQENYLKNYSKEKFVKKTLKGCELYNIKAMKKYVLTNFDSFLKLNTDLSSSIKNYILLYKSSFDELLNLKNIGALTIKDYNEIKGHLKKFEYSEINNKLLYLTLKNNSNDILAQKNFFQGIVSELNFNLKMAKDFYLKATNLNAFEARYYNNLGKINYYLYEFADSIKAFNNGLNISNFRTKKNQEQELQLLNNLAEVYKNINDLNSSFKTYVSLLVSSSSSGNRKYEWLAVYNIALINASHGNYNTAINYLNYSLKLATKLRNKDYIAKVLTSLSKVQYNYGDYTNGKKNGLKAIKYAKKISNLGLMARASLNVCLNYEYLGRTDLSTIYCNKTIEINDIVVKSLERPVYYLQNAGIYDSIGFLRDYKKSLEYYKKAYELSKQYDLALDEISAMYGMADSESMLGNYEKSNKLLQDSKNMEKKLKIEYYNCRNCAKAFLNWREKKTNEAIKLFKQIMDDALMDGNNLLFAQAGSNIAIIYYYDGNYKEALKFSTLSLNTDKKMYRFDHHYIKYQEGWQNRILKEFNNKKGK